MSNKYEEAINEAKTYVIDTLFNLTNETWKVDLITDEITTIFFSCRLGLFGHATDQVDNLLLWKFDEYKKRLMTNLENIASSYKQYRQSTTVEFEEEVEKYRLVLKEKLDAITGEDWTVITVLEHKSFEYECTLGDFWRVTSSYDIVDIEILKRMDEAIERQAFLVAYHYTEYIQAMETA